MCCRLEVYCGKKAHLGGPQTIDDKSGPAAVLRNMAQIIPPERDGYHLVVIDRFYTSVSLALELLAKKIYVIGTIQTNRIGFPNAIKDRRKKRPKTIARGSHRMAVSTSVPSMIACCWWDSKPVHMLATGSSLQLSTTGACCLDAICCDMSFLYLYAWLVRSSWIEGVDSVVPCPKLVKDYHENMGGVDVHDQLRLQRYSVQMAFKFKKYYKTYAMAMKTVTCIWLMYVRLSQVGIGAH